MGLRDFSGGHGQDHRRPDEGAGSDFSKIQGRFKTPGETHLSQDVEEVIRKRLLEKNEQGAFALQGIYAAESANFKTLFGFADGSKTYKNYVNEDLFIGTYPFVSYQFPLFQQAIEGLSEHNAFEGKNSSVGERSMLGVVQQVAKELGAGDVGSLASFDHMFAGIRSSLKGAPQRQVQLAEQNLDNRCDSQGALPRSTSTASRQPCGT
jgi:hypothetical protein